MSMTLALTFRRFVRLSLIAPVLGLLAVSMIGCDSRPATGTKVEESPQIQEANKNMEEFMKKQQQGKGS